MELGSSRQMVSERGNTQEQKRRNKRQSVVICIPGIQPRHLPNLLSLSLFPSLFLRASNALRRGRERAMTSPRKTGTFLCLLSRISSSPLFRGGPPPRLIFQRETRVVGFVKAGATLIYEHCLARNRASYPPSLGSLQRYDFK